MSHIESLFNHEFAVTRMARVSDGQGGWSQVPETVGSVEGRLRPATSREREVAAQQQREISHVLYTLAGEDVVRGDLVTGGGLTVLVQGVREPSQADRHWEIDCQELQKESAEAGS